jgi:DNA-binding HxlR family transcriptional regulator
MATTSAAQQREISRQEYNANLAECPGHEVLAALSDKWLTLVVSALADGPLRHSELARIIAGASQKMLTQTLRKLERDGLVVRTVTASVPPRVDYELTALGADLVPLQRAIKDWAEAHIGAIHSARREHDARQLQRLRFRASHLPTVRDGRKRVTMRFDDPVRVGPALLVFESDDEVTLPGRITSTVAKRVDDVTDDEAREDGFAGAAEVLSGLLDYYPRLRPDSEIVIVRFEVA